MTLEKLVRVLETLKLSGASMRGRIHATGGGELSLSFFHQLQPVQHAYLLRRGFVYVDLDYIYRPR